MGIVTEKNIYNKQKVRNDARGHTVSKLVSLAVGQRAHVLVAIDWGIGPRDWFVVLRRFTS